MKPAKYLTDEEIMNMPTLVGSDGILKRSKLTDRHLAFNYEPGVHPEFDTAYAAMSKKLDGGGLVILAGTRGTGKTQMGAEYAKVQAEKWKGWSNDNAPIAYRTAKELLAELRIDMNESGRMKYGRSGLLIIDEVQVHSDTDDQRDNLTLLVDKRYANMLPTLIIGNLEPAELRKALGTSIMDRTRDGGAVIFCNWKSLRGAA